VWRPNTEFHWKASKGVEELRAIRTIKEGEEITDAYLDLTAEVGGLGAREGRPRGDGEWKEEESGRSGEKEEEEREKKMRKGRGREWEDEENGMLRREVKQREREEEENRKRRIGREREDEKSGKRRRVGC
jgi:hypothetical protein